MKTMMEQYIMSERNGHTVRVKTSDPACFEGIHYTYFTPDALRRFARRARNQKTRGFFARTQRHSTAPAHWGEYADIPEELVGASDDASVQTSETVSETSNLVEGE